MRRVLDTLPWLAALVLLAAVAQPSWAAKSPDEMPEGGTANAAPPAARVSYLDGTLYCWGPFDDEKRHLILNDIVREGDELYAAPGTWAEIEFPGSTFLRLDGGSSVIVQHYRDDLVLIPTAGAFYVSTGDWNRGAVRFGPDSVEAASASLVRLDISPDEYRRVATVHGLARLEGDDLSIELVEQEQAWAERFGQRWELGRFVVRDGDDFDLWNLDREEILRRPLDEDTPSYPLVGYSELHDYGTWVVVDGVWVWRPYVEAGWRPFTRGEWIWVGGYGWTWASGHSWGYVTSHHGRWVYDPFYGWVWMPGMTWAPAWVTWSVQGHYVGWCPIDWWGYPVVITVGWYSYWDYRCWTFSHHDYFYHGGYHHHGSYHYHHHHANSHRRHGNSHSSHGGGQHAGSSHARHDGDTGASASHERDSDGSNSRTRAFGSDFRTFDKGEFEAAQPSAVRNANTDLLRRDTMGADDRQAYERGGTSRDSLLAQRFTSDRQDATSNRPGRGTAETSRGGGDGGKGTGATGIRAEGSTNTERSTPGDTQRAASGDTSRAAASSPGKTAADRGTASPTTIRPHTSTTGTRSTYAPVDRSSSSSTGTRSTYTVPDRSSSSSSTSTTQPYVPRYNGRSDGQKGYSGSRSSSSSSGSSSSRPSYTGSSSSRSKSSTSSSRGSSSSTRSSSSSSSKSKSSSGSSRSSSSSSKSKSSGSKKKK